jgi:hypothetical protein
MWKKEAESSSMRIWKNSATNSECHQTMCFKDKDGNEWWEFDNLMTIPFTRSFAATKVTSLYALGLTMADMDSFILKHKETLKGTSPEKYEMAYAELLDLETRVKTAADPIKQLSSLVCVYFTINDELIDSFLGDVQLKKMELLEADPQMNTFFLKRQIELIEGYKTILSSTLPIVLQ